MFTPGYLTHELVVLHLAAGQAERFTGAGVRMLATGATNLPHVHFPH